MKTSTIFVGTAAIIASLVAGVEFAAIHALNSDLKIEDLKYKEMKKAYTRVFDKLDDESKADEINTVQNFSKFVDIIKHF